MVDKKIYIFRNIHIFQNTELILILIEPMHIYLRRCQHVSKNVQDPNVTMLFIGLKNYHQMPFFFAEGKTWQDKVHDFYKPLYGFKRKFMLLIRDVQETK